MNGFILAASIVSLAVAQVQVARWYEEFGNQPADFYPDVLLNVPYVLFLASVMLIIERWWAYLLAMVISGWLIYSLGYMGLLGVAHAHDWPLLSREVFQSWFALKYGWQSQELYQLALAIIICVNSLIALLAALRRRRLRGIRHPTGLEADAMSISYQ